MQVKSTKMNVRQLMHLSLYCRALRHILCNRVTQRLSIDAADPPEQRMQNSGRPRQRRFV